MFFNQKIRAVKKDMSLMYPTENDDISKRVNIFSKFMLEMLQNLYI